MSESEEMWNSDSDSGSDYDMFDPDNYTPTKKEDIAFNIAGAIQFWDSNNEGTIIRKVFANSIESLEKKEAAEPKAASCDIDQWDIIRIFADKNNKTLSFIDCGLGMTKDELEAFGSGGDLARALLVVADKVVVTTKHNDEPEHVLVLSPEQGKKKVVVASEEDPHLLFRGTRRGTKVTLFLKQDKVEDLLEFTTYKVLADLCFSTKIGYYIFLFSTEGDLVSVTGFRPNSNTLLEGSYDINSPINYWEP